MNGDTTDTGQMSSGAEEEPRVFRVGGISYLRIPAEDPYQSAAFYQSVFGWSLRGDPDDPSFEDGTGHVIGHFIADLPVAGEAGLRPYIFVERIDETLERARRVATRATPVLAKDGADAKGPSEAVINCQLRPARTWLRSRALAGGPRRSCSGRFRRKPRNRAGCQASGGAFSGRRISAKTAPRRCHPHLRLRGRSFAVEVGGCTE